MAISIDCGMPLTTFFIVESIKCGVATIDSYPIFLSIALMRIFYGGKDRHWNETGKLAGGRENHVRELSKLLLGANLSGNSFTVDSLYPLILFAGWALMIVFELREGFHMPAKGTGKRIVWWQLFQLLCT